uniref:ATP synthase complex subunit 8 n=1 Tax=Parablepharis kuhlii asiatica TaxID=2073102 RepID=A0A343UMK9_9NEOP|nr:ATP synthase F0 subunit 8 [Parablepharis kuhlii asiatica]
MPQMMPLNWLMLFMLFSSVLLMFNVLNFYMNINMKSHLINKKKQTKTFNWKW